MFLIVQLFSAQIFFFLHKFCFQFLKGQFLVLREMGNNTYEKEKHIHCITWNMKVANYSSPNNLVGKAAG